MRLLNIQGLPSGEKAVIGVSAITSVFINVQALAIITFVFILIDFVFGVIVSLGKKKEGFQSQKAYNTIWKVLGAEIVIGLGYLFDTYILTFIPEQYLVLANVFAGFICGAELWSILTNFAILSNHPVFRLIKKWGKAEIENKIGVDISELDKKE
jgi:phage-related holin